MHGRLRRQQQFRLPARVKRGLCRCHISPRGKLVLDASYVGMLLVCSSIIKSATNGKWSEAIKESRSL